MPRSMPGVLLFTAAVTLGSLSPPAPAVVVYELELLDGGGGQAGSGFLSVEQAVLDAAPDYSGVNPTSQAPVGSKFVSIQELEDLSFTVFGMSYGLADHNIETVSPTIEGVIFDAGETFRQFIDANIPGQPQTSSATFIDFGASGARLLFNENFPAAFQVEGSTACPATSPVFDPACTFSVTRVVEPATPALLLMGMGLAAFGGRQRHRLQTGACRDPGRGKRSVAQP